LTPKNQKFSGLPPNPFPHSIPQDLNILHCAQGLRPQMKISGAITADTIVKQVYWQMPRV